MNEIGFKERFRAARACMRGQGVIFNMRICATREPSQLTLTPIDPRNKYYIGNNNFEMFNVSLRLGESDWQRAEREMGDMDIQHGWHSE